MPLKEALGSDAGFDPTEEDRNRKVEESSQGRVVSKQECKEALEDFLNPTVASVTSINQYGAVSWSVPKKSQIMWWYLRRKSLLG